MTPSQLEQLLLQRLRLRRLPVWLMAMLTRCQQMGLDVYKIERMARLALDLPEEEMDDLVPPDALQPDLDLPLPVDEPDPLPAVARRLPGDEHKSG